METLGKADLRARLETLRAQWWARVTDAWRFGERQPLPAVGPADVAHRAAVLAVVLALTGVFLSVLAAPGVGVLGKTVGNLAGKFSGPVGSAELPQIAQRSVVVDRNGKLLATLAGEENRLVVPLSDVPDLARKAVIAIEDAQFYEHHGVDLGGLTRAVLTNFRAGGVRQGGSTITQQLVKNTLVGTERSVDRKIREARLAVKLEKALSKDQILETYLNETYFGNGVYGIATAAEFYFGKKVRALTLSEGALLAGIIKAPERFDPIDDPDAARRRRTLVLHRMADEGFISRAQADAAARSRMSVKPHPLPKARTPYFVEYVKQQLLDDKRLGATRAERARALFQAGLRIETTLDLRLQEGARRAVEGVLDRRNDPDAALASIDPKTGAVRAMVSGRNFKKQKYDLATQGRRQPGSTFKPFTLVAALEKGIPPGLTLDTPSPITVKDQTGRPYEVGNYDDRPRGYVDMRRATELSINTYYVQLIKLAGESAVVDVAKRMGITSPMSPITSLSLGTKVVSPLELASAYGTLANRGVHCKPFAITKVKNPAGQTVLRNERSCERAIEAKIAAMATDILRGVPLRGTGRENGRIGRPNAAKTGTTNSYVDAWYAGYTPQFATVVWLGFADDTRRPLKNIHGLEQVFGGSLPAMIWSRYMRLAHARLPVEQFPGAPGAPSAEVPNVVGMTVAEARALLGKERFGVAVDPPGGDGVVRAQDPPAGSNVEAGSLVTLSLGKPPAEGSPTPSPEPSRRGKKR